MVIEPPMSGAPGLGLLLAKGFRKVCADQRMRIERNQIGGCVALNCDQLGIL
jgi:hypothetical protein